MHDYSVVFLEDKFFKQPKLGESSFLSFPRGKSQRYLFVLQLNGATCTRTQFEKTMLEYYGSDFHCRIPDDILQDIRENRCKLVFDYSSETNDALVPSQIIVELIQNTARRYSLTKNDIMLCTGNFKSAKHHDDFFISISNFYFNTIQVDDSLIDQQRNLIANKTPRTNKCLCLMRKPRTHRVSFAQALYKNNLLDNNIVTLGSFETHEKIFNKDVNFIDTLKSIYDSNFIKSLPWTADVDHLPVVNALMNTDKEKQLYLDSTINFIVESTVDFSGIEIDLTEKIIKPIAAMQPFILYGQVGALAELKHLGYKTFDLWWDESYDNIPSSKIRMHYVVDLFKYINSLSVEHLAEMHYAMLPVLEHNLQTYKLQQTAYHDDIYQTLKLMFNDK
jgi:hypothetical protein